MIEYGCFDGRVWSEMIEYGGARPFGSPKRKRGGNGWPWSVGKVARRIPSLTRRATRNLAADERWSC